jgi:carbon-monoxide dehydrogenase medium subunit
VVVKPFILVRAECLAQATEALAAHGSDARVMAGGQSLLKKLKTRSLAPAVVVAVDRVAELHEHTIDGTGAVSLGAASTYRSIVGDRSLHARLPLLPRVAADLADIAVRTLGTIGGSLCEADPVFDMPVLCTALEADLVALSLTGERILAAGSFFTDAFHTALRPDELVTAIRFPVAVPRCGASFRKVRFRRFDAASASVGCTLRLDEHGAIGRAHLVVGAATAVPTPVPAVAELLAGQTLTPALAAEAGRLVQAEIEPDNIAPFASAAYKRELLGPLVRAALLEAHAAAWQEEGQCSASASN